MNLQLTVTRLSKLIGVLSSAKLLERLIVHRVFAGVEHRSIVSGDLATVVDIGANRGQFALAARKWAPNARIISFEPLAVPASIFRRVFRDDAAVVLHEAAIGRDAGFRLMHVSARDDSSSLLPISDLQVKNFPGTGEMGTVAVRVAPLESYVDAGLIASPAMLKLDVQGFELEALLGCESLLHCFDRIYCECSFVELYQGQALAADIVHWLSAKGFRLGGIFNPTYDRQGRALQADFLFEHERATRQVGAAGYRRAAA